jgi:hypothetical protein
MPKKDLIRLPVKGRRPLKFAASDLPDGTRKYILQQDITGYTDVAINAAKIKGDAFIDPTVAACLPISVENPVIKNATATPTVANTVPISVENAALAYDATNDEFYVRSKSTSRPIYADLRTLVGAAISKTNPMNVRIGDGTNDIPFPTALDTGAFKTREQNPITGFATQTTLALIASYIEWTIGLLGAGLPSALSTDALKTREQGTPSVNVSTFPDNEPFNLNQVGGTAQTAADWTPLLQKLDAALSTMARLQPWYQPNFTTADKSASSAAIAPHTYTSRWSYTVPAGRIAIVASMMQEMMRDSAPSTAARATMRIYNTAVTYFLRCDEITATVGVPQLRNQGWSIVLLAGDVLTADSQDLSTGGTYLMTSSTNLMVFDT